MPRTGALLSLSREHHTSLVLARAIRRAVDKGLDAGAYSDEIARLEAHWHTLMAAHFEQEERLIKLAADALDSELAARIIDEHAEIRMLACGPCSLEPIARLRRFADLVIAHVRYEERTFFPQLQSHPCVELVAVSDTASSKGD